MSLSVPLEPPSKEILHISAHYLVILVKYIYIFNSIQFNHVTKNGAMPPSSEPNWCTQDRYGSVINTGSVTDDCFSSLSPICSLTNVTEQPPTGKQRIAKR